jgi:hypothetical protein
VFEIVNIAQRESVLAVTTMSAAEISARLGPARPGPMAHWPAHEDLFCDCLADAMTPADAEEFMTQYARSTAAEGWKIVRWIP